MQIILKIARAFCIVGISLPITGCVSDEQRQAANGIAGELAVVATGVSSKIFMPLTMFGSNDQRSFRVHGHYCGKGFPINRDFFEKIRLISQANGVFKFSIKSDLFPVDLVDQACARHDICYAISDTDKNWRKSDCDVVLMCDLYGIRTDRNPELISPRAKVLAWAGGAAWYNLSSDCAQLMRGARPMHFIRA